jgi:hypothetical protein
VNIALLNDYEIDIVKIAKDLESKGFVKSEIKEELNNRYRTTSKKGDFRCFCCNEKVEMVLADDKIFHFRHSDKEKCAYSENHKTYTRQKENLENSPKHRVGRAILRTYLEGACNVNNIKLIDGYHFESTLSFVPDFILEYPNGKRLAIDYITGLKNDSRYANNLDKRRNSYIQYQFTPIFFFDSYWLAYEPEINHVSLVDGELLFVNQTREDDEWTNFIRGLEPHLKEVLLRNRPYALQVNSMVYIDPNEREMIITRFLQENNNPQKTRTVCEPIKIPLEQGLMINDDSPFTSTSMNENEFREILKRQLAAIYQEIVNLRKQQEMERDHRDEQERKEREIARAKEEENRQRSSEKMRGYERYIEGIPFSGRNQRQMDEDLKRDMEALQRRNTGEEPYWYKQVVHHMMRVYGDESEIEQQKSEVVQVQKNEYKQKLPSWKVDEILDHYVTGEAYFIGNPRRWKEIVLNSYELINANKLSVPQLLKNLQDQGIEFKQSEKIMSYPINEYMQFIRKKVKK